MRKWNWPARVLTLTALKPRLIWACFLAIVLATSLPGLTRSPPPWQDEVQILDYGRVFLAGQTAGPAVSFIASEQRPIHPLSYLGCVASELSYRLTGSAAGPRLLAMLAAMLYTTLLLLVMLRHASGPASPMAALLICGAALLEPLSFQSCRGARLDATAIALVISGWWLLEARPEKRSGWLFALVGGLLGLSFFVWPRVIIAWPLVLLPLLTGKEVISYRTTIKQVLCLGIGCMVAFASALPPAMGGLDDLKRWDDSPLGATSAIARLSIAWHTLMDLGRPHLPLTLTALIGCIALVVYRRRQPLHSCLGWLLCGGLSAAAFATSATPLHHFNRNYLVPLLVLITWAGWQALSHHKRAARALLAVVALMFAGNFTLNVVLRSAVALRRPEVSGLDEWRQAITPQDRVLAPAFTPYYALRALGVIPFCYVIGKEGMDDAAMLRKLDINVLVVPSEMESSTWVQGILPSFGPQAILTRLKNGQIVVRRGAGI